MKTITLTPDASGMVDWPTLSNDKKSVVTIGSFDGMHQGHQAVIRRVAELAEQEQAFSVVVLFDPRPALVHAYAAKHDGQEPPAGTPDTQALTSVDERLRAIDAIGVDYTLIVRYTMAFAAKSYRFFLGQMVGKLGMRTLVLGSDAAMGANRAGNVKAIENLALATGVFQLEVVDDFGPGLTRVPVNAKPVMPSEPGEPSDPLEGASKAERRAWSKKHQAKEVRTWSSTNVRYLLSQGRIKDADAILGHAHAVEGTVVHGEERGRTIGFPTANLSENVAGYLPVDGVYAGWLVDLGEKSADGGEEAGEKPADGVSQQYDASSVNARVAMQSPHRWPAVSSSNVDLPMPGSPAISVTDPGTMPPPSTRSNSENPVAILEMFSVPMSVIGLAADDATGCDCVREVRPGAAVREPAAGRASWNSSMVPH